MKNLGADTNTLNWFEIPANDISRSRRFYEKIFNIEMEESEFNGQIMAFFPWTPGSGKLNGSLIQGEGCVPSKEGSVVYLNANPDLEHVLKRVEDADGKIALPKTAIGDHGFIAFIIDTEGNKVGLHSST